MADLRSFSKEFITEFIELYKSYPCLWKTKSKEYMNRNQKNEAYKVLLLKLQEVEKNATKETIKTKINSLRSSFRRETKKIQDSKKSGTGADDVYVPHLWYYDLLLFVKDQEIPRLSVSNIDDPANESCNDSQNAELGNNEDMELEEIRDYIDGSCDSETPGLIQSPPTSRPCSSHEVERNSVSSSAETQRSFISRPSTSQEIRTPRSSVENQKKNKRKAKLDIQQTDDVLALVRERLRAKNDDQYTIFGKNVAAKLRDIPRETKLYTEKLINDLLFEAEMGNVTKNTRIVSIADDTRNPNNFQRDGPVHAYYPNHHSYDWGRHTNYQNQGQNSLYNRNITSINQVQTYSPHTYSRQNQSTEVHSPQSNLYDNHPQTIIQSNKQPPNNSCTESRDDDDETILPLERSYTNASTQNYSSNAEISTPLSNFFEKYNPVSFADNI